MNTEEQHVLDDTAGALIKTLHTVQDSMEKMMVVCKHLSERIERLEKLTGHEFQGDCACE
jgi:hypothetical protein